MKPIHIGVISDTHGLLRPEALELLQGSDYIFHLGDVGHPMILDSLAKLAPLTTVRGNIDKAPWAQALPLTEWKEIGGYTFFLQHILADLAIDPPSAGVDMVLFGHSHKPFLEQKENVWYFNPGSAGKRRFSLPITMGKILVSAEGLKAEHFYLEV
ncbi:MAG: metallophosphoesterase family protein [Bacteroidota bacterium]